MNQLTVWKRVEVNVQAVAEAEGLIPPGAAFALTPDQDAAVKALTRHFGQGERAALLLAPTGAGKTEVAFRVALAAFLRTRKPVYVLSPTRDLVRQTARYFAARLEGLPLAVAELHGGVAPQAREALQAKIASGMVPFVVGSGLLLKDESYRMPLREGGFLVVDDVHAFDPVVHLKPLSGVHTPALFLSATPEPVERFLKERGALDTVVELKTKPFAPPTTVVTRLRAKPGATPNQQLFLAAEAIARHVAERGRIYVVARQREGVPKLAAFVEGKFDVPTLSLHGEMVDTAEQARRMQRWKQFQPDRTRVAMMARFRETLPAAMVATNLLGAGLDVPMADCIVITDADYFGPAELEQLIGRVGRRDRPAEAYLITGTRPKGRAQGRTDSRPPGPGRAPRGSKR